MKNTFRFLGIIVLTAVIGFSFASCKKDDPPEPKTLIINGIPLSVTATTSELGVIVIDDNVNFRAAGNGSISGMSATIPLTNVYEKGGTLYYGEEQWTGSGSFIILVYESNNGTFGGLDSVGNLIIPLKVDEISITSKTTSVNWASMIDGPVVFSSIKFMIIEKAVSASE